MTAIWRNAARIGGRWVTWVQQRTKWAVGVAGLLAALAIVYVLPLILVPGAGLDAESRLNAENDLRTTMVQALGGAVLLGGTALTLHLNRQGQITDRFSRAIEHLGHAGDKLEVRLGGIYALERIARDSKSDQGPIVDVLTAFLREQAQSDADTPCPSCNLEHARSHPEVPSGPQALHARRLRADLQAAATVLGRNRWPSGHAFVLPHVDLRGVKLAGAHFEAADLHSAYLEGADLRGAHLEGADLSGAHLEGANLRDAHLGRNADGFMGASLCGAKLHRADLAGATLEGALLVGADLERANLTGARLQYAALDAARLQQTLVYSDDLEGVALDPEQLAGTVLVDIVVAAHKKAAERSEPARANAGDGEWMESRRRADEAPAREEPSEPPDTDHD